MIGIVRRHRVRLALSSALVLGLAPPCKAWEFGKARAESASPTLLDEMDGATPAFRLIDPQPGVRIVEQRIGSPTTPEGAVGEQLVLAVPPGQSAHLAYALVAAPVLEELKLRARVWCNRPGVQLAAFVTLPRSIDPETQFPRRLLVRRHTLAAAGSWEDLEFPELPQAVADAARVFRAAHGEPIDERGAMITHLVVLAPGGPGPTEVWIDRIAMYGPVVRGGHSSTNVNAAPEFIATTADPASRVELAATSVRGESPLKETRRPSLARIIQWQGEPFALLKELGFDAIAMGRLATAEELDDARRLGIFLVCPPPPAEMIEAGALENRYDQILAWDLGELSDDLELSAAEQLAAAIERRDPQRDRPKILRPGSMPLEASRLAEATLLGRSTLGSTLSWTEYAAWLSQQRRLARPGTMWYVSVETHWTSRMMSQLAAIRSSTPPPGPATLNDLTLATAVAFPTMPRGFYFASQASLATPDDESRARRAALELTNLRLGLVEPWLTSGKAASPARCSVPGMTALVLTVERSHLIIPVEWERQPGRRRDGQQPISFVLPTMPEACDAYLLTLAGPRRLSTRRVAGGLMVSVDELPNDALILLTEDGYAFSRVNRYLRQFSPRSAQARVHLAAFNRQKAAKAIDALPPALVAQTGATTMASIVDGKLAAVHETVAGRDYAIAYARAAEADLLLEEMRERLVHAVWPERTPGASPVPVDWSTIADLARVAAAWRPRGTYHLFPAGDFEDLDHLLASGWKRSERRCPDVSSAVRLSPEAPALGGYCLELEAIQVEGQDAPLLIAAPPVWVSSPAIEVPAGQMLEITGKVRVTEVPLGTADPVLIFDSIGGEESAVRIDAAPSWRTFRLLRAAPRGSSCQVTIALGGAGRAQVDALSYRYIPLNPAAISTVEGQAALPTAGVR